MREVGLIHVIELNEGVDEPGKMLVDDKVYITDRKYLLMAYEIGDIVSIDFYVNSENKNVINKITLLQKTQMYLCLDPEHISKAAFILILRRIKRDIIALNRWLEAGFKDD